MNHTRDVELNAIGVLKRREIEVRIVAPLVDALCREFGWENVLQTVRETIVGIGKDQGRQLVQISEGNGLRAFAAALPRWTKEDSLEIDVIAQSEDEGHPSSDFSAEESGAGHPPRLNQAAESRQGDELGM